MGSQYQSFNDSVIQNTPQSREIVEIFKDRTAVSCHNKLKARALRLNTSCGLHLIILNHQSMLFKSTNCKQTKLNCFLKI